MSKRSVSKWYFTMVKYRLLASITFGAKRSHFRNKCNNIRSAFLLGLSAKGFIQQNTTEPILVATGNVEDRLQQLERALVMIEESVRSLNENQGTVERELSDTKRSLAVACRTFVKVREASK